MKWNMMMLSHKRHLIFMVLFNVLLINCGYVQARPNASATIVYESDDKSNVSKKLLLMIVLSTCGIKGAGYLWDLNLLKGGGRNWSFRCLHCFCAFLFEKISRQFS